MACWISSDDGDSWANYTDVALRVPWSWMGSGVSLFNGNGDGDLLLLLSHVVGS